MILKDRVKVNVDTLGTGVLSIGSPYNGFQGFTALGSGNIKTYYSLVGGTDWETGEGTYYSVGNTFSRDIVFESSNSGNLVNLSSSSTLFITYPSKTSVHLDSSTTPSSGQYLYSKSDGSFSARNITSGDINHAVSNDKVKFDGTISYTLLDTNPTIVDISEPNAVKYLIKAEHNLDVQILECLAISRENNVYITIYGLLYNNQQLVRIDSQMYNGYINLYATATSANTDVKIYKILI